MAKKDDFLQLQVGQWSAGLVANIKDEIGNGSSIMHDTRPTESVNANGLG